MFEELRKRLRDGYYSFLAKRYIRNLNKKDSSKELSLEVVPEEVKYKVLEEGLTDDKDLIYSLIMNLASKEQRQEMIKKYITEESYPKVEELLKLPEPLRIELLEEKVTGYYTHDIKKIVDSLSDTGFVRLVETNKERLERRLNSETKIDSIYGRNPDVSEFLESILYSRYQKIEDEETKSKFDEIISVDNLKARIEDKIYSAIGYDAERYILENIEYLIDESKKVRYLQDKDHDSSTFIGMFKTLSKESRLEVLKNNVFSREKINGYIAERRSRGIEQRFGVYLREYLESAEVDFKTIEDLYYVTSNYTSDRILLYNMVEDEEKAKLILSDRNYNGADSKRTDMVFGIQDEEILIDTIHEYAGKIDRTSYDVVNVLYEYLLSKMSDDIKVKVVKNEIESDKGINFNLFIKTLTEVTSREDLKEILLHNFTDKRFYDENNKSITVIEALLVDKIVEHNLSEELLLEGDINNYSEETKFLLLLNSGKETREKILEENEELRDIVETINENEQSLKTLSDGTSGSLGRLTFYRNLIKEINRQKRDRENNEQINGQTNMKKCSISEKLAFLEKFQAKHASIGETILFDFLDDEILNEFGGLENVENLVRYPGVQRYIIDMEREHLKVVRHINSYVSNNLENGDYVLTEILGEYFDTYEGWRGTITRYPAAGEIYSAVAKYISTHDDIPEEVNRNIFNIITNSRAYSRMFSELDRNMTMEDIENIEEVKGDFFDKIITGENKDSSFGVKEAYLLKYYNISLTEAKSKVTEYMTFIESLDDTPENLPLKKYIFALHNVLVSNTEILSIAYEISKQEESIDRIEIEVLESAIKEKIAEEIKDTLYKPSEEKIGITSVVLEDGTEKSVDVYEAKDDFNMLVTVLDAYGGGEGVYENYEEQWNTNKNAQNQRICTTYIGNNSLKPVKRNNCVIYGFTEFPNSSLVKMAPYDIVSKNNGLVTTSSRDVICMDPKTLINTTRRYNEIDIERTDENGEKIQPSYIICFAKSMDEVNEESKKAAAQFGIPIILIDREKIAEKEAAKIDETLKRFVEEKDISLIDNIVEEFCNNKFGSETTVKDKIEAREQGTEESLVHIDEKYFSDERLVEVLQTMIDVAKAEEAAGNIEKSKEILAAIKAAVKKECGKQELWQKKFGAILTNTLFEKEIFDGIIDQISTPEDERARLDEKKVREKLEFLTKIDGDKNKVELGKREETFREDSYTMEDVQQKILDFTPEELEMICDYTYRDDTIQYMYALMVGKDAGLSNDKINLIIAAGRKENIKDTLEGFFEEENDVINKLYMLKQSSSYDIKLMIELIENPVEKQMKENEDITNQIFEAAIEKGIIYERDYDIENLTLEDKIEILKGQDSYEIYKVVDDIRMKEQNEERADKIFDIEHYFSFMMGTGKHGLSYMLSLPEEERKEFILMVKVMTDAKDLAHVAENRSQINKKELLLEEAERYLPTAFQIQEAFANQRLDEVIDKEGYEKDRERIKEKLAEDGRSPVEYAYELDRFFEKKKVNEKGEEK